MTKRKQPGKKFEEKFKKSCQQIDIFCYRLKDSPSSFYQGDRMVRFTPHNIADFFIYKYPNLSIVECKSTKNASLPFANFSNNQIKNLNQAVDRNYKGLNVYLLVEMRKYDKVYILNWRDCKQYMDTTDRKSFSRDFIKEKGQYIKKEGKYLNLKNIF